MKKIQNLSKRKPELDQLKLDLKKVVYNMSRQELTQAQEVVLSKGFNFAIAPRKIPTEEIISGAEVAIDHLPKEEAEELLQEIATILRTSKPPKPNLTREEFQALKELKENSKITIVPADKGNATVVMDVEEYTTKMEDILKNTAYKQIKRDLVRLNNFRLSVYSTITFVGRIQ